MTLIASALYLFFAFQAQATDLIADEIRRIELNETVAKLVAGDQAIRFGGSVAAKKGIQWEALTSHPLYQRRLAKIDGANKIAIKEIIKIHGWPKISEYGQPAAQNVWLLVQHMDDDVAYQEESLALMKDLLPDEVDRGNYAYLVDRVRVNEGGLQVYGSQGACNGKSWEPKPMEDPENLEKRRAEMGLPSREDYKKLFLDACIN
jgi:hypothetical protein